MQKENFFIQLDIENLTQDKAKKVMEELYELIEYHNYRYWQLNEPLISDEEYDLLLKKLEQLEKKYPQFKKKLSPVEKIIDAKSENFEKVKHEYRLYSLSNVYEESEFLDFLNKNDFDEFIVEPKYDGISVEVIYDKGNLLKVITRGDGTIGEDITENAKFITNLPLFLLEDKKVSVRGEVLISKDDFKKLNEKLEKQGKNLFANPRNAAAGSIRLLEKKELIGRNLKIVFYELLSDKEKFKTEEETLIFMKNLGLPICEYKVFKLNEIDKFFKYRNYWINEYREKFEYEVDGLVIKENVIEKQEKLGYTAKSPKWAIAFKFPANTAITILEDVIFQVGRTGIITPVGVLQPVRLSGAVIKKVTLHNFEEIKRKDIRIKDKVVISRSGDVIPKIVKVLKEDRTGEEKVIEIPQNCPVCGSTLVKDEETVFIRCISTYCPAQLEARILHMVNREAFNIPGIGQSLVKYLVEKRIIKDLADIFYLNANTLLSIPLVDKKKALTILEQIEKAKKIKLSNFIYGLGISLIGKVLAKQLAGIFVKLEKFLNFVLDKELQEKVKNTKGIGEKIFYALLNFLKDEHNVSVIEKMLRKGVVVLDELKEEKDEIAGKKIVITGKFSYPRNVIKQALQEKGAIVLDNLTLDTDIVLIGEKAGSKKDKAIKLREKNEKLEIYFYPQSEQFIKKYVKLDSKDMKQPTLF